MRRNRTVDDLFGEPPREGEDVIYARFRNGDDKLEALQPIRKLWRDYRDICPDKEFPKQLQTRFVAMHWQMQLSVMLRRAGYDLVKPNGNGPDICIQGSPRIWIECTAPERGDDPNRVPESQPLVVWSAPEREIILRITSAIASKTGQVERWKSKAIVRSDDILLLAVTGANFGLHGWGGDITYAEKAVFGVGNENLRIGLRTGSVLDRFHGSQESVEKRHTEGSTSVDISTKGFLSDNFSWLSGLMWSPIWRADMGCGEGIFTIHNAHPVSRLSPGYFKFGVESFSVAGGVERHEWWKENLAKKQAPPSMK